MASKDKSPSCDAPDKCSIPTVDDILRGSANALTVFGADAASTLRIFLKRGKPYLHQLCYAHRRNGEPQFP